MMMQIALPDLHAPATLILDREHPLTDDEYFAFCEAKPDIRLERTSCPVQFICPMAQRPTPRECRTSGRRVPKEERRRFPRVAEFVVEVMSPSDRLRAAQRKMRRWIDNGVDLGWLIDADNRTVHVYCAGQEPRQMREPEQIEGEGPVEGLVVDLKNV